MKPYRDMTAEQWNRVQGLIPELRRRSGRKTREMRGRPLADTRAVLNAVLWVMYSGASWASLPRRYPSYQTCHRRFKAWHTCGAMREISRALFGDAAPEFDSLVASRMRLGDVPAAVEAAASCGPRQRDDAKRGAAKRSAADTPQKTPQKTPSAPGARQAAPGHASRGGRNLRQRAARKTLQAGVRTASASRSAA